MSGRQEVSPEVRWSLAIEWQNAAYEMFMDSQRDLGHSDEEAHALLKRIWAREDEERLLSWARAGRITSRVG